MGTLLLSYLLLLLSAASFLTAEAGSVGVNYGRVANNLPTATKVVELLKSQGITQVKLYDADATVLKALAGTGIHAVVTLPNEQLAAASSRLSFAISWIQHNVAAFHPSTTIRAIAVGNEVFVDPRNLTAYLIPAMRNLHSALVRLRLDTDIKLSSPIALTALQSSYPSSAGSFRPDLADSVIRPMLDLLRQTNSSLMVNAYPFFAYEANSDVISLDYALFRPNPGVVDAGNGLKYLSLLDAQIDAVYAAMSQLKYDDVPIVISETGWPSKGDPKETGASAANAAAYNGNLVRRVLTGNAGTPRRPKADIDVYLFALFNENQKPGPTSERNYGLFYPNEEKVYEIDLSLNKGGVRWNEDRGKGSGGNDGSGSPEGKAGEKWCVSNAAVGRERLQAALDYACGEGGADCRGIQPGATCYDPNTVEAHSTFAFNSYYQKNGRVAESCDFAGAAYVVSQQPKVGKCSLPAGA
ncbi:glucan endo-1,3-beta-glucosidase 3 [Dendrobium catenatum]|uniref:glucan endo-1,3-beta-glucosidase 3 n=1 Tax=Dendrobium catenatum TaxID=906689 RepID=UPI0009F66DF2|nr:glucan endo-1,3-beta-glucosidase 3 [Dendrobium catenatum]